MRITIPMPRASEIYFSACGKIDQHDRMRMECGINKKIQTNRWDTRVNPTILAMIFTDAWMLYKLCKATKLDCNPTFFVENLACELIDRDLYPKGTQTRFKKRQQLDHSECLMTSITQQ